ncbi:MAG: carbohydrate binding family 9 domain-containing protein [Thermoanaerobaculia bacterium]|nr:carbohydrate binding family 9 domain-containing protein [Thermoanaerobaculia bacterium]
MNVVRLVAAFVLGVCLCDSLHAAEARKSVSPIRIDGVLDESSWQGATPIPIAYEWFPGDNIAAAVKTDVLITWDDDRLYVAFRASDPNSKAIRARYAERDAALLDDNVGILLDPYNDDRRAYQFRVNPLGVQADAINSDVEGSEDFGWDAIWDSAGRITAEGFIVEMAIPLQQLRIPTSNGAPQTWGIQAMRDWPRDVRHRFRSTITDQNRNCLICQFADVTGFRASSSGRNLEVTPTLTGTLRQERDVLGEFKTAANDIEPGVSARWGITSGTSLQATLNPDFSQVEADAAQLDVNTRFALSFPEKRPFFLEGSDFFETQMPLVYTRTIRDPLAGLKLTGKSGGHAYGLLFARDRVTNFILPSDESSRRVSVDEDSTSAVFRYRGEVGSMGTAGGLVSSRTGPGYSNTVLSGDTFLRVSEQDSIRVQAAVTRTDYPFDDGDSGDGHALRASYSHADRDWSWSSDYEEYSSGFRADVGLFNQVGVRAGEAQAERRIRGDENRWFRNLYLGVGVDSTLALDGDWTEWGADIYATYQGPRQSNVSILLAPNQEYFEGRTYHNFRQSIDTSIQASRDVSLGLFVNWGETIDFSNAQQGTFVTINPSANFNIGRRLRGEVSWVRQTLDGERGGRVFTVDIPQARFLYHFNRRTFVRAILQHRGLEFEGEDSRTALSQLLFSYRIDAQTVFLAGYSDNYEGIGAVDLTQSDRTVFVKLSYAWLF